MPTSFSSESQETTLMATPAGLAYVVSGGRWKPARHLQLLSRKLSDLATGRIRRLIVSMPPRHGKSELCSHWFPIWLLNTWPDRRVILASFEADFAASWGRRVRNTILEHQDVLQVRLSSDSTAANRWETVHGGGMVTAGVGGSITGRGAELLIIDDPVKNAEEAYSETYRQRAWDWWTTTASTRLEPGASAMVIMTRWHDDDLAGRLLERAGNGGEHWETVVLPALAEEDDPLGRAIGDALWPSRYTTEELLRQQQVDPQAFAAMYQQCPVIKGGDIFDEALWRRYAPSEIPVRFDTMVQSWDLAFEGKSTSDWNVGAVWGRKGGQFWLLDLWRKRAPFDQVLREFKQLQERWPWRSANAKLLENKANGPALRAMASREIPGIIPIEPDRNKVQRAWAVQPYHAAGNLWIPRDEDAPWVRAFVYEHKAFPKGRNDDMVDTTTQALSYLSVRGGAPVARVFGATEDWSPRRG